MGWKSVIQWGVRLAGAAWAFASASTAFAQSCAMCATTASSAKAGALQALRSGILILLIPPILMFIAIFTMAFRNRERFNDEFANPELDGELSDWLARMEPLEADTAGLESSHESSRDEASLSPTSQDPLGR